MNTFLYGRLHRSWVSVGIFCLWPLTLCMPWALSEDLGYTDGLENKSTPTKGAFYMEPQGKGRAVFLVISPSLVPGQMDGDTHHARTHVHAFAHLPATKSCIFSQALSEACASSPRCLLLSWGPSPPPLPQYDWAAWVVPDRREGYLLSHWN